MSSQLDILALEPFYGGVRRTMLEALIRCSRHRWTLLKLPPRRIERRLAAAAHWFSEQLKSHFVGKVDLLFTSEAMNLSDLFRLRPGLAQKPSVVYFHANQLPPVGADSLAKGIELANLSTGAAATELWFNSAYHLSEFLRRASALVDRHPELSRFDSQHDIVAKAHILPPPTDLEPIRHAQEELIQYMAQGTAENSDGPSSVANGASRRPDLAAELPRHDERIIFLDTRDADMQLLSDSLEMLQRRNEKFRLITVGPLDGLSNEIPRAALAEIDYHQQARALTRAGILLSGKRDAPFDHHFILAMAAGCWPIVPDNGFYSEQIPKRLDPYCLYSMDPDSLVTRLQDFWHMERPEPGNELVELSKKYDLATACRTMDDRLSDLAAVKAK